MNDLSKVHGALGLCRRAGKCVPGDFAAERAVKSGKAGLVVVDSGASEATRKRYKSMCDFRGIQYIEVPGMGSAIGKPNGKVAAITDPRFIHMICSAAAAENKINDQTASIDDQQDER